MTSDALSALPPNWVQVRLSDIAEVRLGRQRSPGRAVGEHMVPYLRAANVTWQGIDVTDVKHMDFTPKEQETYRLQSGDILLSEASGSPGEVGKPAIWRDEIPAACFQNTLLRVRARTELTKYLHLHFLNDAMRGQFADGSRGVGINHLGAERLSGWRINLAPLAEQKRIVAAIEERFTRLDAVVAGLKRVQQHLKRYRASVLKAACEGRLVPTEAELARAEGRTYEPADQLLARILEERRARWEADQLAKMQAAGKPPKSDAWKAKYEAPLVPQAADLTPPPQGWGWATVEQLNRAERPCAYGVLQPGPDVQSGVPLIRVGDIDGGVISLDGLKHIHREIAAQYPRTSLRGGELLITLVGTIGRTAIAPTSLAGANTARAVGVIALAPEVEASWVEIWFRNPEKIREMTSKSHEVARKTLNLEDVRTATVGVPPLAEQRRIVAEVERRLSVVEKTEAVVEANLKRAAQMRQAILKQAFEGKLVPQDPNDEPASVLLERIRAERDAAEVTAPKRRGRRPAGKAVNGSAERNGQLPLLEDGTAPTAPHHASNGGR